MLLQIHAFTQQQRRWCLQTRHHADPVTHASHYLLLSWQAHSTSGAATLASHNKMWWATLDRKCWHAYFSLPPSVRIKQDFFFFPSQKFLCCVFRIPRSDFLFLNWSSYGWEVGCFQHKCQNRCWQRYVSAKPQKCWNFTLLFLFICETFFFRFQFFNFILWQNCACVLLRFRHQNHLVRVRKRSFLA